MSNFIEVKSPTGIALVNTDLIYKAMKLNNNNSILYFTNGEKLEVEISLASVAKLLELQD